MNNIFADLADFDNGTTRTIETRFCEKHQQDYRVAIIDGTEIDDLRNLGCQKCHADARAKELAALRRGKAPAIPPRFEGKSFADLEIVNETQEKHIQCCRSFVDNFPKVLKYGSTLVLSGKVGTGKTHLAAVIGQELYKAGYGVIFTSATKMLTEIKSTYSPASRQTTEEVICKFAATDLLIVDDVGRNAGTKSDDNLFFDIINRRYNRPAPTIVVTNLNAMDLKDFVGTLTFDRLVEDGVVMGFDWESYRRRRFYV